MYIFILFLKLLQSQDSDPRGLLDSSMQVVSCPSAVTRSCQEHEPRLRSRSRVCCILLCCTVLLRFVACADTAGLQTTCC